MKQDKNLFFVYNTINTLITEWKFVLEKGVINCMKEEVWYDDLIASLYDFQIGNYIKGKRCLDNLIVSDTMDSLSALIKMKKANKKYCLVKEKSRTKFSRYIGVLAIKNCEEGKKVGQCSLDPIYKNLFHWQEPTINVLGSGLPYILINYQDTGLISPRCGGHEYLELLEITEDSLLNAQLRMFTFNLLGCLECRLRDLIVAYVEWFFDGEIRKTIDYVYLDERKTELTYKWENIFSHRENKKMLFVQELTLFEALEISSMLGFLYCEDLFSFKQIYDLRNPVFHWAKYIPDCIYKIQQAIKMLMEVLPLTGISEQVSLKKELISV